MREVHADKSALVKPVQPRNASFPILVREAGKVTVVKLVHSLNAPSPILVREVHADKSALVKLVHPLNANTPILVREAGKVTLVKAVQLKNATSPIFTTV